jgi:Flp pilus assembly protein CpaB
MAGGKRRGGVLFIILALVLIAALAAVYFLYLRPQQQAPVATVETPVPAQEMVDIVVTSQFVSRGTLITESVLTTIKFPKAELVEGMFYTDIVQVIGKRARLNLEARIPVTNTMLMDERAGSLASADIPSGMTAFSIPIAPETSVSFAPQQYDHVMVVACIMLVDVDPSWQTRLPNNTGQVIGPSAGAEGAPSIISASVAASTAPQGRFEVDSQSFQPFYIVPSETTQRSRLVCQTVIQDSLVLKVGQFALATDATAAEGEAQPTEAPASEATETPATPVPTSITLVVTPQDTVILNYLLLSGAKMSLALRGAGDSAQIATDPVTLQYIMDSKNIPLPAKLPYAMEPRVDSLVYPSFGSETVEAAPAP